MLHCCIYFCNFEECNHNSHQCENLGSRFSNFYCLIIFLPILQVTCNNTGSGRNTWRFGNTAVSRTVGMGNLSLSALLAKLKAFQLPQSAGLYSIGILLWRRISKTMILSWLRGYFVGTSIFIGTSVPSRNTSFSEDISRARCTKRNQGQWWIWNRTSRKKWQQFLPTCCNEWSRTSRNVWGNVLTRDATSQTLYSGSECCN